jgi:hypothetical protein
VSHLWHFEVPILQINENMPQTPKKWIHEKIVAIMTYFVITYSGVVVYVIDNVYIQQYKF